MKILLLNLTFYPKIGGVENSLKHLTTSFSNLGHSVTVVCGDQHEQGAIKAKKVSRMFGGLVIRFRMLPNKGYLFTCYLLLLSLAKRKQFDLVLSRSHITTIIASFAGFRVLYLVPGIASSHERADSGGASYNKVRYWYSNVLQKLALRLAARNLVFSETMRKQVFELSPRNDTLLVSPGCDPNRFYPQKFREDARRRLGLPVDKKIALCVGRLTKMKGFDDAIDIIKLAPGDYFLCIVGKGPELQNLKQKIESLSLCRKVKIIEGVNNPESYFAVSDYYLFTSNYEPFGQVLLEAAFSELRVIAFSKSYEDKEIDTAAPEIFRRSKSLIRFVTNRLEAVQMLKSNWYLNPDEYELLRKDYSWNSLCQSLLEIESDES